MTLHINLANHFAETAVDDIDAPPPHGPLLFYARQSLSVELEILCVEVAGQPGRRVVERLPAQIRFPRVEVGSCDDAVERLHVVRSENYQCANVLQFSLVKKSIPIEVGHYAGKVFQRHFVVIGRPVPGVFLGHVLLGQPRLKGHNGLGCCRAISETGDVKHALDVRNVLRAQLERHVVFL